MTDNTQSCPTAIRHINSPLFVFLVVLIGLAASLLYNKGGILYYSESDHFLVNYLEPRPFLHKIFDVQKNETDGATVFYRGRELGYLFDWLDANFIAFSLHHGLVHLYSLTFYASLGLIALFFTLWARRCLTLDYITIGLLLALFLTAPPVFFTGFFFRSNKILTALTMMLCIALVAPARRAAAQSDMLPSFLEQARFSGVRRATLFVASLMLALADEQGRFILTAACAYFGARSMLCRRRREITLTTILALALASALAYNYLIGPWLIKGITNYDVSFVFQQLPWSNYSLLRLWQGFGLLNDTFRFFLGNLTPIQATALLAYFAWLFFQAPAASAPHTGATSTATTTWKDQAAWGMPWVAFLACITIMFSIMLIRFDMILQDDIRRIYYWTPALVGLLLFTACAGRRMLRQQALNPTALWIIMSLALVANIFELPRHARHIQAGYFNVEYATAPAVRESLRRINDPDFVPPAYVTGSDYYHFMKTGWRRIK